MAPDGIVYLAESTYWGSHIRKIGPAMPGVGLSDIQVASEDGSVLYQFNRQGKHLRTIDTLTGLDLYQFTYDSNGYVIAITDLDGDVTTIERDENSLPKAIIAPDGQKTRLVLNQQGYLTRLIAPDKATYKIGYTEDGLLTRFTTPKGHTSKMQYDELGRFFSQENPVGGGWTIARVEEDDHYEVSLSTALGRTTAYRVENLTGNNTKRINTSPDGTQTEQVISSDGTVTQTRPDGTLISQISGPDPRFGMQSPLLKELTIQLPSGLTATTNASRTVELSDPSNLTQPKSITDTTTYNGTRTHTSVYQAADNKITTTSAEGRQTTSYLDDKGRLIKEEVPGLANVYYDYDERGRIISLTEGEGEVARTATITYDPDSGYVAKITDALDRSEIFTRDKVGRILSQELPDGRQINYRYDANGNVTSITPPSKPVHQFDYTAVDLQQQYTYTTHCHRHLCTTNALYL